MNMRHTNYYSKNIRYIIILAMGVMLISGCDHNQYSSTTKNILSLLAQLEKVNYSSSNSVNRKIFSKKLDQISSYGDNAIPVLIEELGKTKNSNRKLAIICSLGKIGGEKAEEILINNVNDSDPRIRSGIATFLGEFNSDKSIKALSYIVIYDSNSYVKQVALLSLGRLGNEKALEVVKSMLKDKNSTIREAAQIALDRINANKKDKN